MKIALGMQNKLEGFTTVDIIGNPDIICDLDKQALPLNNNVVEYVIAEHVLEHMKDFIGVMKEIHRVCCNGAIVEIRVPYSYHGFDDPTHVQFFSKGTFKRFTKEFWDQYGTKCWYIHNQWFKIQKQEVIEHSYVTELYVVLMVVK